MHSCLRKTYGVEIESPNPVLISGLSRRHGLPKLFKQLGFLRGAEIGVARGINSERFLMKVSNLCLICVDPWEEYEVKVDGSRKDYSLYYQEAVSRLSKYNCVMIRTSSLKAASLIPDGFLDFVYIDANHYYRYAKEDLEEWSKKVRKGGIVSGHDYFDTPNCGVIRAVREYTAENGISRWFLTGDSVPSYFWEKK